MRRTLLRLCPLLALSLVLLWGRSAAALDIVPGQEVAIGLESAMAAGSVTSIIGNAVTLAQGKPSRSWIITGFFFGTLNMVISPLMFVYGSSPNDGGFGAGMGAMHAAVGATNFALSIYGAVLWRRALRAKEQPQVAPAAASLRPLPRPQLSLLPLLGRDSTGQPFAGVSFSVTRF